jgi:hypothetical protein
VASASTAGWASRGCEVGVGGWEHAIRTMAEIMSANQVFIILAV